MHSHHRLAAVALSLAATLAVAASLWLFIAGCGLEQESGADDERSTQARTLALARDGFSRAADALLAGDQAGFRAALAAGGAAAASAAVRESFEDVYRALAPLPWRSFSFEVTPLDADSGLYRVRGIGQLGSAGPPDRIAVVRHLVLHTSADAVTLRSDETPAGLRRRYLMALRDPVVLQRPGLLVLGDRRAGDRVATVAAAATRARPRLAVVGVGARATVVVTVFDSAEDARDALGIEASSARLVFFAYPALRVAGEPWRVTDVGVMGPWLRDAGDSLEAVLAHELAHAFTVGWFAGAAHTPALLVEGIAQTVEGADPVYLREEVASGNQLWPLPESFATEDLWAGNDGRAVGLGYEIGGSLVGYVLEHWGVRLLRPFVRAVAVAEPTEADLDRALLETLGVSWRQFYDGWRRWVLTGA